MHILTPRRELILPVNFGMSGWWKLAATNVRTGRQRLLADWFPNLITDYGLNIKGTVNAQGVMQACHVGSGSAVPSVVDTTLETWVAATTQQQALSTGAQSSAPYFGWKRKTYRFAQGAAAGNLSEIGVAPKDSGQQVSSTDPLFSRALILDGAGNPTTITVLADEVLDATYELRMYPPTTDGAFSVTDSGITYNITARAADVTAAAWHSTIDLLPYTGGSAANRAFTGAIGAITGQPSGTNAHSSASQVPTRDAYVNNSLELEYVVFFGLNDGNIGGIKSFWFGETTTSGAGSYQFEFDPVIAKDDTKELTIGYKVGWGRASI